MRNPNPGTHPKKGILLNVRKKFNLTLITPKFLSYLLLILCKMLLWDANCLLLCLWVGTQKDERLDRRFVHRGMLKVPHCDEVLLASAADVLLRRIERPICISGSGPRRQRVGCFSLLLLAVIVCCGCCFRVAESVAVDSTMQVLFSSVNATSVDYVLAGLEFQGAAGLVVTSIGSDGRTGAASTAPPTLTSMSIRITNCTFSSGSIKIAHLQLSASRIVLQDVVFGRNAASSANAILVDNVTLDHGSKVTIKNATARTHYRHEAVVLEAVTLRGASELLIAESSLSTKGGPYAALQLASISATERSLFSVCNCEITAVSDVLDEVASYTATFGIRAIHSVFTDGAVMRFRGNIITTDSIAEGVNRNATALQVVYAFFVGEESQLQIDSNTLSINTKTLLSTAYFYKSVSVGVALLSSQLSERTTAKFENNSLTMTSSSRGQTFSSTLTYGILLEGATLLNSSVDIVSNRFKHYVESTNVNGNSMSVYVRSSYLMPGALAMRENTIVSTSYCYENTIACNNYAMLFESSTQLRGPGSFGGMLSIVHNTVTLYPMGFYYRGVLFEATGSTPIRVDISFNDVTLRTTAQSTTFNANDMESYVLWRCNRVEVDERTFQAKETVARIPCAAVRGTHDIRPCGNCSVEFDCAFNSPAQNVTADASGACECVCANPEYTPPRCERISIPLQLLETPSHNLTPSLVLLRSPTTTLSDFTKTKCPSQSRLLSNSVQLITRTPTPSHRVSGTVSTSPPKKFTPSVLPLLDELLGSPSAAKAIVSVGVTSAAASTLFAIPSSAGLASRSGMIAALVDCSDASSSPAFLQYPPVPFATLAFEESRALSEHATGVLSTGCLLVGLFAIWCLCVRLPSAALAVEVVCCLEAMCCQYFLPALTHGLTLVLSRGRPATIAAVVVSSLAAFGLMGYRAFTVFFVVPTQVVCTREQAGRRGKKCDWEGRLVTLHGAYFESARDIRRWYVRGVYFVELTCSVAIGLATTALPILHVCAWAAAVTIALCSLLLAFLVWSRPYERRLDNGTSMAFACVQALQCWCAYGVVVSDGGGFPRTALAVVTFVQDCGFVLQLIVFVIFRFYLTERRKHAVDAPSPPPSAATAMGLLTMAFVHDVVDDGEKQI